MSTKTGISWQWGEDADAKAMRAVRHRDMIGRGPPPRCYSSPKVASGRLGLANEGSS